jgi:hypothetical protein
MVDHDPLTERSLHIGDTRAAFGNDSTWLMTRYVGRLSRLVGSKIAAAHTRGANRHHDFSSAWMWIGEFAQFNASIAEKDEALHMFRLALVPA